MVRITIKLIIKFKFKFIIFIVKYINLIFMTEIYFGKLGIKPKIIPEIFR